MHLAVHHEAPRDVWTSGSAVCESCVLTAEDIHPRSVPARHLCPVQSDESQTAGAPAAFCPAAAEQLHRCVCPGLHTASALGSRLSAWCETSCAHCRLAAAASDHRRRGRQLTAEPESHGDRGEWRRERLSRRGAGLSFPSLASVLFPLALRFLFHLQPFRFPTHSFLSFPSLNPSSLSFPFIPRPSFSSLSPPLFLEGPSLSLLDQITVDSHSLARDQFL